MKSPVKVKHQIASVNKYTKVYVYIQREHIRQTLHCFISKAHTVITPLNKQFTSFSVSILQPLRELLTWVPHTYTSCGQVREAHTVSVSDGLHWGYKTWSSCHLFCLCLSDPWLCHSSLSSVPNSLCQGRQPMHTPTNGIQAEENII